MPRDARARDLPAPARPRSARAFLLDPGRRLRVGLGLGAAALLLARLVAGGHAFAVSYLPAWLCLLALPAGALPVVIMIERADAWRPQPETALLEALRGLLALMPVAALLAVPVLLARADLRSVAPAPGSPGAALWYATPVLGLRLALCFAAWTALAWLFARRGGEPWGKAGRIDDGRAVLGLGLHGLIATLVADDLVMAVSAPFRSSLAGLVLMASWSSLALSAAILVAPPDVGPARRRLDRLTPLAVLLAVWAALHGVQVLTLGLGGDPAGTAWYAARGGTGGRLLALSAVAVVLLAAGLVWKPGENRTRLVAALALAVHGLELGWFVTPALRGRFAPTAIDLLALIGVAGLGLGLLPQARRLFADARTDARDKPGSHSA